LIENAQQLKQKNSKLKEALKKLEETQSHMLQSEKMASIGQLAAGVAHEINNPTGFVSSNLKTLSGYNTDILGLVSKYRELHAVLSQAPENSVSRDTITAMLSDIHSFEEQIDLDYLVTDITELIEDCREGTGRIKKIVADLKDFAHPGNEQLQLVDINKGLDTTLNVVNNEIKYKATVKKQYGDLPLILGFPQQLNQVFMNILVNAAQAIEEKGDITVVTQTEDGYIEVNIADTGSGIEKKNLPKIFEPFFTTKDVGKGTGLGMHIAFNIIQKHKGTISVASEVGKGTQFKIRLPIPVEGEGN
jgi:two-component system NtrC family sensor kinase